VAASWCAGEHLQFGGGRGGHCLDGRHHARALGRDVYSLGVLLYELLTGRTPFDPKMLVSRGIEEVRRLIRDVDPPRPSAKLNTLSCEEPTTLAQRRRVAPAKFSVLLKGDLDWIVMKCLEKGRARRYETANGLATDLQRHLRHQPVVARPPSRTYLLQKFVRRNRVAVAATSAGRAHRMA
jgi:eukaryotic-like serine/threonine-protein kinase